MGVSDGQEFIDITLTKENDYLNTVDNLIVGADCSVVEELETGGSHHQDLGESVIEETESGGAAKVDLGSALLVVSDADEVPVITVTNSFEALATTGTSATLPTALALVLLAGGAFMIARTRKTGRRRA